MHRGDMAQAWPSWSDTSQYDTVETPTTAQSSWTVLSSQLSLPFSTTSTLDDQGLKILDIHPPLSRIETAQVAYRNYFTLPQTIALLEKNVKIGNKGFGVDATWVWKQIYPEYPVHAQRVNLALPERGWGELFALLNTRHEGNTLKETFWRNEANQRCQIEAPIDSNPDLIENYPKLVNYRNQSKLDGRRDIWLAPGQRLSFELQREIPKPLALKSAARVGDESFEAIQPIAVEQDAGKTTYSPEKDVALHQNPSTAPPNVSKSQQKDSKVQPTASNRHRARLTSPRTSPRARRGSSQSRRGSPKTRYGTIPRQPSTDQLARQKPQGASLERPFTPTHIPRKPLSKPAQKTQHAPPPRSFTPTHIPRKALSKAAEEPVIEGSVSKCGRLEPPIPPFYSAFNITPPVTKHMPTPQPRTQRQVRREAAVISVQGSVESLSKMPHLDGHVADDRKGDPERVVPQVSKFHPPDSLLQETARSEHQYMQEMIEFLKSGPPSGEEQAQLQLPAADVSRKFRKLDSSASLMSNSSQVTVRPGTSHDVRQPRISQTFGRPLAKVRSALNTSQANAGRKTKAQPNDLEGATEATKSSWESSSPLRPRSMFESRATVKKSSDPGASPPRVERRWVEKIMGKGSTRSRVSTPDVKQPVTPTSIKQPDTPTSVKTSDIRPRLATRKSSHKDEVTSDTVLAPAACGVLTLPTRGPKKDKSAAATAVGVRPAKSTSSRKPSRELRKSKSTEDVTARARPRTPSVQSGRRRRGSSPAPPTITVPDISDAPPVPQVPTLFQSRLGSQVDLSEAKTALPLYPPSSPATPSYSFPARKRDAIEYVNPLSWLTTAYHSSERWLSESNSSAALPANLVLSPLKWLLRQSKLPAVYE